MCSCIQELPGFWGKKQQRMIVSNSLMNFRQQTYAHFQQPQWFHDNERVLILNYLFHDNAPVYMSYKPQISGQKALSCVQ